MQSMYASEQVKDFDQDTILTVHEYVGKGEKRGRGGMQKGFLIVNGYSCG